MKFKKAYLFLLSVLLVVAAAGCGGGNSNPQGRSYTFIYDVSPLAKKLYVTKSQNVNFALTISGDHGYTYTWTCSSDPSDSYVGKNYSWTAPSSTGQCTVNLQASDGGYNLFSETWTINVCESASLTFNNIEDTSGARLSGLTVQVTGTGVGIYEGTTVNGSVTINNIPAGDYFIRFSKSDLATYYDLETVPSPSITRDFAGVYQFRTWEQWSSGTSFFDSTKGTLVGGVFDSNRSDRLGGVAINFTPASWQQIYFWNGTGFVDTVSTTYDALGIFLINGISPSTFPYTLSASKSGESFNPLTVFVKEPCVINCIIYSTL